MDIDAAGGGRVGPEADQIERARQRGKHRERRDEHRQDGQDRFVARDVEHSHQPPHGAERVGEVGQVLGEHRQRREERRHRHAREEQDRGRQAPPASGRQRVDDAQREERAGKAGQRD